MHTCPQCGHTFPGDQGRMMEQVAAGMLNKLGGATKVGEIIASDYEKVDPKNQQRSYRANTIMRTLEAAEKLSHQRQFVTSLTSDQRDGAIIQEAFKLLERSSEWRRRWNAMVTERELGNTLALPALPDPNVVDAEFEKVEA